MFITSKRGAKDNIVTYEHICDTTEDLQKIDPHYITLGSTCIVVQGENGGVDAYIATSDKQWVPLGGGSGGSSEEEDTKKYENSNVRFIDYDGKVVDGYTAEEFLQLNKMPKNPNHKNDKIPLTAQGWNWSLADIKAYMTKYPNAVMTIGQMYIPTDGKTHIVLDVGVRKTIPLMIQQTVSKGVTINWGDDSEEETIEGTGTVTTSHTYEDEGEYDIALEVADGCTLDFGGDAGANRGNIFGEVSNAKFIRGLKEVYIGKNVVDIKMGAFANCNALYSLTIPEGITEIANYAFIYCYTLISLTIPNSTISIGQNAFQSCMKLTNLSISDSVTSIGQMAFSACHSLTNLVIPNTIESIGKNAFVAPYNLTNLIIPDSITSIEPYDFSNCYLITNLTIPNSIVAIGQNAFDLCYSLYILTILAETPPTLVNVNAFAGISSDCTIYVPHGKGDIYKADSKWSTWASQIQELPE